MPAKDRPTRASIALRRYLEDHHLTSRAFLRSRAIPADESTLSRLLGGRARPRIALALALEQATEGTVRVAWWAE